MGDVTQFFVVRSSFSHTLSGLPGLASKHRGFLPFELERELQKFLCLGPWTLGGLSSQQSNISMSADQNVAKYWSIELI